MLQRKTCHLKAILQHTPCPQKVVHKLTFSMLPHYLAFSSRYAKTYKFRKVARQRNEGMVGSIIWICWKFTSLSSSKEFWKFVKNWQSYRHEVKVKARVWTLAIAQLTWVRLVTSSALQSGKWQLIGMSQWCRSALCHHPLPSLMDNWTHGAASRHTIAPISHTRPSPRSRSYYSFPVPLRVGGWVGLSTQ